MFKKLSKYILLLYILIVNSCGNSSKEIEIVIDPLPAKLIKFNSINSVGKSGYYYLPTGYNLKTMPLMFSFHGTNYHGIDMINEFKGLAEKYKFILVAPDSSRVSKEVPEWDSTSDIGLNEDFKHSEACLNELLEAKALTIDYTKIMANGFSAGSWFAAYYSSNSTLFTHYGSLHGGVTLNTIGNNRPNCWFSCGTLDDICSCALADYDLNTMSLFGFKVLLTKYPTNHRLILEEKEQLVVWWLSN